MCPMAWDGVQSLPVSLPSSIDRKDSVCLFYSTADNNQIYFTGRNIFPNNSKLLNNFTNANIGSGERSLIVRKPFLLEQFNGLAREDFVNIVSGSEHFVLLTCK